jgi:hypothetical protein
MSGFKRHIAASIAITAVFIICALTLFVSAAPVVTTGEGTQDIQTAGAFSYASMVPDVVPAEAAPAEPPQEEAHNTAAPPAPLPPAPDVSDAPAEVPADAPEVDPAKKPGTDPIGVINPPMDLVGEFVPDIPPYVQLDWDPNNRPKFYDFFNVYRMKIDGPDPGPVQRIGQATKPEFQDYAIELGVTYRYWVTAVATWGEESGPSNAVDVETQAATPPAPPQGVEAWALDPGVSLDWLPNTEPNLAGYNVYRSQGGRWKILNKQGPLADPHFYDQNGVLGDVYAVSAVNTFEIESGYTIVQPQETIPVVYEESDPSISVEGLWVIERYLGPTNGQILVAEDAGARLHFQFTGAQVQMITAIYWTCGAANVYIDGELVQTVNMYSDMAAYQVIDVDVPGLVNGDHVLTLEVLGSGNPVEPYNFVNIDAFVVR